MDRYLNLISLGIAKNHTVLSDPELTNLAYEAGRCEMRKIRKYGKKSNMEMEKNNAGDEWEKMWKAKKGRKIRIEEIKFVICLQR
jgi:hypothetical protein